VRDTEGMALGPTTLGAIIDIGKSLKLTIIAEGIETAEQSMGLERLGCDLLQGFRFFRPMDAQAHSQVLMQGRAELQTVSRSYVGDTVSLF
jgi:c-di-GMP phosphodiesterase